MLVIGRSEVEAVIDIASMAVDIEAAYVAASAGEVEIPPVGHITFPDVDGDCHIKYGHRRGDADFVIKIATGFPHQSSHGQPTGNGMSLVISATTGEVQAILHDEMLLTDIRTGIGGAIATRRLARSDATKLLIVGTGVQARRQIEAHVELLDRPLDVRVWGRSAAAAATVVDDLRASAKAQVATDLAAACRWADIIATSTAADEPIIADEWIAPGTHITAVGADASGKHELDAHLLQRADLLVADSAAQCLDHGEFSAIADDPERASAVVELGNLLARPTLARSTNDITIADLTGIAAQDIAAARNVLAQLGIDRHSTV